MRHVGIALACGIIVLGACRRTELVCDLPAEDGASDTSGGPSTGGSAPSSTGIGSGAGGSGGGASSEHFNWLVHLGAVDTAVDASLGVTLDGERLTGCMRASGPTPGIAELGGDEVAGDAGLSLVCFSGLLAEGVAPELAGRTLHGDAPAKLVVGRLGPGSDLAFAAAGTLVPGPERRFATAPLSDLDGCALPSCFSTGAPNSTHAFVYRAREDEGAEGELAHLTCNAASGDLILLGVAADAGGTYVSGRCRDLRVDVAGEAPAIANGDDPAFLLVWPDQGPATLSAPRLAGELSFDPDDRLVVVGIAPTGREHVIALADQPDVRLSSLALRAAAEDGSVATVWPDPRYATVVAPCDCAGDGPDGLFVATNRDEDVATRCSPHECDAMRRIAFATDAEHRFAIAPAPPWGLLVALDSESVPTVGGEVLDGPGSFLIAVPEAGDPEVVHTLGRYDGASFEGFHPYGVTSTSAGRTLAWGHSLRARDPLSDDDGYFIGEVRMP